MHFENRPPLKVDITGDLFSTALGLLLLALPVYCLWPVVQWAIGSAFDDGAMFLRQDAQRAAAWYQRSIAPRAFRLVPELARPAYRLGLMHLNGRGVAQDPARARELLKLAAERGSAAAQNDLYVELSKLDQPADWPEALGWLRQSVAAGHAIALCNLGGLHAEGAPGVLHDPVAARALYERAHREDATTCAGNLSFVLDQGLGGDADLPRARALRLEAARRGDREAMYGLAEMLRTGRGGPADPQAARQWLREGGWTEALAQQGDDQARFELARSWYEAGFATQPPERPGAAFALLLQAAEGGVAPAMALLAEFHELGIGTAADPAQALRWHERASAAGAMDSTLWLADRALKSSQPASPELVARLDKAARDGHARAQLSLAALQRRGLGMPADPVAAHAWLSVAAAMHPANTEANQERDVAARSLSAEQLAQAQAQARLLWNEATRRGSSGAAR